MGQIEDSYRDYVEHGLSRLIDSLHADGEPEPKEVAIFLKHVFYAGFVNGVKTILENRSLSADEFADALSSIVNEAKGYGIQANICVVPLEGNSDQWKH